MLTSTSPIVGGDHVVPSDTVPLRRICRGIYLGGAGDVAVITSDGKLLEHKNMLAGVYHPVSCKMILATGTTATDIIAGY